MLNGGEFEVDNEQLSHSKLNFLCERNRRRIDQILVSPKLLCAKFGAARDTEADAAHILAVQPFHHFVERERTKRSLNPVTASLLRNIVDVNMTSCMKMGHTRDDASHNVTHLLQPTLEALIHARDKW